MQIANRRVLVTGADGFIGSHLVELLVIIDALKRASAARITVVVPYYGYVKKHNQTPGMAAMVSASKDGGFLAGILECFGVHPVRGSSRRRRATPSSSSPPTRR